MLIGPSDISFNWPWIAIACVLNLLFQCDAGEPSADRKAVGIEVSAMLNDLVVSYLSSGHHCQKEGVPTSVAILRTQIILHDLCPYTPWNRILLEDMLQKIANDWYPSDIGRKGRGVKG